MFTRAELMDAIDEFDKGKHSIQNCEKLAAIYTVLDHLNEPDYDRGYSGESRAEAEIEVYGDSEFLKMVAGKPPEKVWQLIDELVEALGVLNPRLQTNFMDKLRALR